MRIIETDALPLARQIRTKELSPVEVVDPGVRTTMGSRIFRRGPGRRIRRRSWRASSSAT